MKDAPHVLIVEDEEKIARLLMDYLQQAGYCCTWQADGLQAEGFVRESRPDLVLLDLMLPGRDGLDVCRALRQFSSVPIIMLTARVEEIDRLLGLEIGADDYVCKPFSPREVVSRVRALLRRAGGHLLPNATSDVQSDAGLALDSERFSARLDGQALDLTPVEFRLLATLHAQPGRVFGRETLLRQIYDDHRVVSERTVDSHIKNLRRKLQDAAPERDLIQSVYGVGYRFGD
ncbi:MAG: response regulator [Pseudomonadota bacterium]